MTTGKDLAAAMTTAATRAAFARLKVLGWTPNDIETDRDAIAGHLAETVAEAWPAALADARDAFAAGMEAAGVQTFEASIVLAGIEAANRHNAATKAELVTA